MVDRDDDAWGDGIGPGEQRSAPVERAVEHGGLTLEIQCADQLDVEPELLGPAVLRQPVRRRLDAVQERTDRSAGLVDGLKSDRQLIVSGVVGWWAWLASGRGCEPG